MARNTINRLQRLEAIARARTPDADMREFMANMGRYTEAIYRGGELTEEEQAAGLRAWELAQKLLPSWVSAVTMIYGSASRNASYAGASLSAVVTNTGDQAEGMTRTARSVELPREAQNPWAEVDAVERDNRRAARADSRKPGGAKKYGNVTVA